MRMHQFVLSIVSMAVSASVAFAQGGTEFTYQCRLLDEGTPANGTARHGYQAPFNTWHNLEKKGTPS